MRTEIGGIAFRLEGVINAAETCLRADGSDSEFIETAARRRLMEALELWAMERFRELRGRKGRARKLVICIDCGRWQEHASRGRCESCRGRLRPRRAA